MYKIIGVDGKEYGPVSAEQVRQWIAERRANAQTKVLPEGSTEWKPLGELPEFAGTLSAPPATAPLQSIAIPYSAPDAASQLQGPAIGLLVVGILDLLGEIAGLVMNMLGLGLQTLAAQNNPAVGQMPVFLLQGGIGIAVNAVGIVVCSLIVLGAVKMLKLKSYGMAMASAVMVMLPCVTPCLCCVLGIPFGIWALVVLSKPEVKAAFE